jgi:ribosomal protein S18 acetylase RimI-like enzyme
MKNSFGITTRKCRKSDQAFVYRMVKLLYPYITRFEKWDKKQFDKTFNKTYRGTIILLKGNRRMGLFHLEHDKPYTYITRIFISPAYQRKGIGTFILNHFEDIARSKSKKRIRLQVWIGNPAFKFYKKLGYKVIKKKNNKYLMEKKI